jgi:unsaturated rhamnogalacturonyl hydrolase
MNWLFEKKQSYPLAFLLIGNLLFGACNPNSSEPAAIKNDAPVVAQSGSIPSTLPWSERVALTLMKENPQAWMTDFQKKPKWNYTNGLVMMSIQEVWKRTGKNEYYDYAKSYADTLIDAEGNILGGYSIYDFNIDHITPGRMLFPLLEKTKDPRYEKALQTLR